MTDNAIDCPGPKLRRYWVNGALCLLFATIVPQVQASFSDNLTIGNAKALALGHAVTADPPGIDSIHYNPAGLTRLKGRQMHLKFVYGLFETNYEFGDYGEYQQGLIDRLVEYKYPGSNGVIPPEAEDYFYDETLNTSSKVEGPTVMLPGGMVDLPFAGGPMGGASYSPPGSNITFATNVYAPMMSGFNRAEDDPGRFLQRRSAFTLLTYFSPSIGVKISDELQVGFALNFSYAGMGLDLPAREPHLLLWQYGHPWFEANFCNEDGSPTGVPDLNLCHTVSPYIVYGDFRFEADNPLVLSYNFGLLWSPEPWLTFGLSYNSAVQNDLDGDWEFPIDPFFKQVLLDNMNGSVWPVLEGITGALGLPLPGVSDTEAQMEGGKVNVQYELPQRVNLGVSIQVTPKWKYNFDVRWTEWSVFSDIQINLDKNIAFLMLGSIADKLLFDGQNGIEPDGVRYQLGLQDVTYWGMGTEFQYSDNLALRFGYENRPSAVPSNEPNAFIPLNDGELYSAGFSYTFESENTLDVSVGYMSSKTHYAPCEAKLGNNCNPNDVAYGPYQGQDIRSEVSFLLFEVMYSQKF